MAGDLNLILQMALVVFDLERRLEKVIEGIHDQHQREKILKAVKDRDLLSLSDLLGLPYPEK